MSLRLEIAAHYSERKDRLAFFRYKRRDDRVERPLVRLQLIEIGRIEREQLAAVLQAESQAVRHKTRAPSVVNALNERDHIAVFVRGC